jgi:hypothetical protein
VRQDLAMKRLAVPLTALLLMLSACSSGNDTPSSSATPTPTPTPTPTQTSAAPADLVISPGRIGDAGVPMSLKDALATGYFEEQEPPADAKPCEAQNLRWKPGYENLDLFINFDDDVRELGVTGPGAKTTEGIAVGDSYRQLQTAYVRLWAPEALSGHRTATFVNEGPKFIGFAFAEPPGELKASSKIVYIQVGDEEKPSLNPEGC